MTDTTLELPQQPVAPPEIEASTPVPAPETKKSETPLSGEQQKDINMLGKNFIARSMNEVQQKIDKGEALTSKEEKVQEHLLLSLDQKFRKNNEFNGKDGVYVSGNPLNVAVVGKEGTYKLLRIDKRQTKEENGKTVEDIFTCQVEDADGNIVTDVSVTYAELMQAQFISEAQDFLPDTATPDIEPSAEDKLLKMYVALQKGETVTTETDSNTVDLFITERAESAGMVTKSILLEFTRKNFKPNENDSTSEQSKALATEFFAVDRILGDVQIPETAAIMKYLERYGISPDVYTKQKTQIEEEITKLTEELKRNKESHRAPEWIKQIATMKSQIAEIDAASAILGENGELARIFDGTQDGTVDKEVADAMISAITTSEDIPSLAKGLVTGLGKEYGWTSERIKKEIKKLENAPGLLGLLAAMMLVFVKETGGNISGTVLPEQ